MKKVNIILGCGGQIGSYLSEELLNSGEYVIGVVRRTSTPNYNRLTTSLKHANFKLEMADITDNFSLSQLFKNVNCKDNQYIIYNLAAMSQVHISFDQPILSSEITGLGHVNVLNEVLQKKNDGFDIKCFFMASSEMMGSQINLNGMQDLETKFMPNSPYAAAKLYAYHMNRIYRESYGLHTTAGIIFNTESPRRGEEFVTRKITKWFGKYLTGKATEKLQLGNILACRDWSHAIDTVKAIVAIANNSLPKDYVVATGETHTIKDFLQECYDCSYYLTGVRILFPLEELYEINEKWFRPNEVKYLKGNACNLRQDLGWKPTVSFKELVREMMTSDYELECSKINGYTME